MERRSTVYQEVLEKAGLSPEEAEIYQTLLNSGGMTASELARNTKVKRTYVYAICSGLVDKGLVTQDKQGRALKFAARSPDKLLDHVESQKLAVEQARVALENVLPGMKKKHAAQEDKPVVTYYEGIEGIKKVYQDTLLENQPISAILQTGEIDPEVREWLRGVYVRKRVELELTAQVIISSGKLSSRYLEESKQGFREVRRVSKSLFPFEQEINIYGDKISFIHNKTNSPLLGIIIDHSSIAKTTKSWFDLAWLGAEAVKDK